MAPTPPLQQGALEAKLKMCIAKKEMIFERLTRVYDMWKNISSFESRSNELFLTESEMIEDLRVKFEDLVDQINEINLTCDPSKSPNYQELVSFDDMYSKVIRVRKNLITQSSQSKSHSVPKSSEPSIKLPPIELPSFDGNTENWPIFYESFRSNIHENAQLSDSQRVQYLVGKLTHNARKVLAGIVPTGDTYKIIWDGLVAKYQDKRALGTHYLNNIFDLKNCQNSASSLDAFIEKYSASIAALKQLDIPDLTDFILLHCALKKIDAHTMQSFEMSVSKKEIPSYKDLISFIHNQVKILERSNSSASSTSSSLSNSRGTHSAKNSRPSAPSVQAHAFVASDDMVVHNTCSCALCGKSDHGSLRDCFQFKNMKSAKDRFNFLKSKQGCVNCLCISHTVSKCTASPSCGQCDKWHNSLLHFTNKNTDAKTGKTMRMQTSSHVCTEQSCSSRHGRDVQVSAATGPAALSAVPARTELSCCARTYVHPAVAVTDAECDHVLPSCVAQIKAEDRTVTSLAREKSHCLSANNPNNPNTILLATAQVYAKPTNGNGKLLMRCLIDNGSQNHLITVESCKKLNLNITPLNNSVIRGVGLSSRPIHGYVSLVIESRVSPYNNYNLHALVVDCITDQLPSQFIENCDMAYLNNIEMADLTWNIPGGIDLVLGSQLFPYIYLGQKIESESRAPPALLTTFGYVLMGDCPSGKRATNPNPSFAAFSSFQQSALQRFWELEEIPIASKRFFSSKETERYYIPHHAVVRQDKSMPHILLDARARTKTGMSRNYLRSSRWP